MDVKVLSKENIKPSVPTPQHLRNYKISFLDQLAPSSYVPVILFYNNANVVNDHLNKENTLASDLLKKSLAETLSYYYPLAGRFKDLNSIECNDDGVLYMEAQANFHLSMFLENPDIPFLNKFLPCKGNCLEQSCQPLLAVQTSTFECGGRAIGVCMLHKVVDASAMSSFLKTWAKLTHGEGDKTLDPDFTSAISLFPPIESLPIKFIRNFENFYFQGSKSPMRRFLFDSKAIKALKANTSSQSVPFPSKIEALTAFLCKRIAAASKFLTDAPKTLVITHVANLRPRVEPPLPQNSFGNLLWIAFAFYDPLDASIELPDLAIMLREVFAQLTAENIKDIDNESTFTTLNEWLESVSTNENIKIFRFTSWCNMGIYDVNYGWGKPVWVAHMGDLDAANIRSKHQFVFLESACKEGIELWIASDDEEIRVVEKDPEFLAYAKPNPSICTN
ncbi:stemmadenine O-acetyltransferase-like [Nicotiana tomentosiformis]|uniref:Vinorine synthase-like n=1 Tax=Nicotiana tabacum TaxID=4097 RepID=A0A1S4CX28_TOBAC|nr:PREDICTED: vinorine synthase-like [Nicotiana tabacum]